MKTSRSPHRILISLLAFVGMFFSIGTLVPSAAADNLIENFPVGPSPYGMAFDGANIWVANFTGDSVTKLRASDGVILDTIPVGTLPASTAFDGENVWVSIYNDDELAKIRASDDTVLGTFPVGEGPENLVFDGANIWVANHWSNSVTKLRASDGARLQDVVVGGGPWGIALALGSGSVLTFDSSQGFRFWVGSKF